MISDDYIDDEYLDDAFDESGTNKSINSKHSFTKANSFVISDNKQIVAEPKAKTVVNNDNEIASDNDEFNFDGLDDDNDDFNNDQVNDTHHFEKSGPLNAKASQNSKAEDSKFSVADNADGPGQIE